MNSAWGAKRKARKIQVDEDDEDVTSQPQVVVETTNTASKELQSLGQKVFKKSTLRQSLAFNDIPQQDSLTIGISTDDDEIKSQSSNKPTVGRSNSFLKKKAQSSRLSFGPGEIVAGDAAEALENDTSFAPKKVSLGRRVIESSSLRNSIPFSARSGEDIDERPMYSKDYLNELRISTPSTPKDLRSSGAPVEDEVGLEPSELAGATVVYVEDNAALGTSFIPSEAEIREKKERRARLAKEDDFISLDDGVGPRKLSLLPRKQKTESRLVREDEDIAEGFDDFVNDGKISLGKKQEREAKRRQRKEIEDLIHQAEGSSDEDSDDSEAERRAAYEAAQTRSGMDGLARPKDNTGDAAVQMPSKITPLPTLSACLQRLQNTLSTMERELTEKKKKMADLEKEKRDIAAREIEVQELLKQAGARYSALKTDTNGAIADPTSLLDAQSALPDRMILDRGLESFGNTPTIRPDVEDLG